MPLLLFEGMIFSYFCTHICASIHPPIQDLCSPDILRTSDSMFVVFIWNYPCNQLMNQLDFEIKTEQDQCHSKVKCLIFFLQQCPSCLKYILKVSHGDKLITRTTRLLGGGGGGFPFYITGVKFYLLVNVSEKKFQFQPI